MPTLKKSSGVTPGSAGVLDPTQVDFSKPFDYIPQMHMECLPNSTQAYIETSVASNSSYPFGLAIWAKQSSNNSTGVSTTTQLQWFQVLPPSGLFLNASQRVRLDHATATNDMWGYASATYDPWNSNPSDGAWFQNLNGTITAVVANAGVQTTATVTPWVNNDTFLFDTAVVIYNTFTIFWWRTSATSSAPAGGWNTLKINAVPSIPVAWFACANNSLVSTLGGMVVYSRYLA